jgi:hypothetical protein
MVSREAEEMNERFRRAGRGCHRRRKGTTLIGNPSADVNDVSTRARFGTWVFDSAQCFAERVLHPIRTGRDEISASPRTYR